MRLTILYDRKAEMEAKYKTEYKHIDFEDVSHLYPKRVTSTWFCHNELGVFLGTMEWNCGWRQYWFISEDGIGYSLSCLNDIADFIKQLMDERKKKVEDCNAKKIKK